MTDSNLESILNCLCFFFTFGIIIILEAFAGLIYRCRDSESKGQKHSRASLRFPGFSVFTIFYFVLENPDLIYRDVRKRPGDKFLKLVMLKSIPFFSSRCHFISFCLRVLPSAIVAFFLKDHKENDFLYMYI